MLNTKAVNTVVEYVNERLKTGWSVEQTLNELEKREEARAGYIRDVLAYIDNKEENFFELEQLLIQEKEIAAQESLLS